MVAVETQPDSVNTLGLLKHVADGSIGSVEEDKGGYWSSDLGVWVDWRFKEIIKELQPEEKQFVEVLGEVALGIGKVFARQLEDTDNGKMWPEEVFGETGAENLFSSSRDNVSLMDPYSVLERGLDQPATPYSRAYHQELLPVITRLSEMLVQYGSNPLVQTHADYFACLLAAFDPDEAKQSDLKDMREADNTWVKIPSGVPFLVISEPTESYYDPARVQLGQSPEITRWANLVADITGLPPWRNFFEFKLYMKDASLRITDEEIQAIRSTSRSLFAAGEKEVPVSIEFRRLLLASGQGSHPTKTAKNYPNFEDIRGKKGYKNIISTNVIEEGVRTKILPALKRAFRQEALTGFSEEEILRGRTLAVVAHEENHPFRIFRDSPLEEMKATINGMQAVVNSERFFQADIQAMILSEIGGALDIRERYQNAVKTNDQATKNSLEAYYKADTMFLGKLAADKALTLDQTGKVTEINYPSIKDLVVNLSAELEKVRSGEVEKTIPAFYEDHFHEAVWGNFRREEEL